MKEKETEGPQSIRFTVSLDTITILLVVAVLAVVVYNQIAINDLAYLASASSGAAQQQESEVRFADVTPEGVPAIYGAELGVSYDDISPDDPQKADATIQKLALQDVNIQLDGQQLERYVKIVSQISCEYCCGAESIIFTKDSAQYKKGDAACGCAHSYAMRGVAKYLITKHGAEFTDDQILEELGKWKTLFFPDILAQKAAVLADNGIEMNYINLASNKYRNIEAGSPGGGMVGGC